MSHPLRPIPLLLVCLVGSPARADAPPPTTLSRPRLIAVGAPDEEIVRFTLRREGGFAATSHAMGLQRVRIGEHDVSTDDQLIWGWTEDGTVDLAQAQRFRVLFLLDESGSMYTRSGRVDRWTQATRALEGIVEALPEAVEVSLNTFNCDFPRRGEFAWHRWEDLDLDAALGALGGKPEARLCTALYNAIAEADAEVREREGDGYAYIVVVISDGFNDLRDAPGEETATDCDVLGNCTAKTTRHRKLRPWCHPRFGRPLGHPLGWIADPGSPLARNDGAHPSDCHLPEQSDPSALDATDRTFETFRAHLGPRTSGEEPLLPLYCWGFDMASRDVTLDRLCTAYDLVDTGARLEIAVTQQIRKRLRALEVTVRLPARWQALADQPVALTLGDDTVVQGTMPRPYGETGLPASPQERDRFGAGIHPLLEPVLALLLGLSMLLPTWLVVPRIIWSRA